jgi:hypothetical protein
MEFMNRGAQHAPQKPAVPSNGLEAPVGPKASKRKGKLSFFSNIAYIVLLFAGTILVVAVLASLIFAKNKNESQFIDKNNLQAVFLNNGQVYFGSIDDLNNSYIKLSNIYYLRVNNQAAGAAQTTTNPNDVSLAKLGCELHGPQDQMVINPKEVTFWENLKSDGQVTKAVQDFIKNNKDGQKCDTTQSTSTDQSTTTPTTQNTTTPTNTTKKP